MDTAPAGIDADSVRLGKTYLLLWQPPPPQNATDSICEAVALYATTETKDFLYALKRGETIDAVTQYHVNKKTGVAFR